MTGNANRPDGPAVIDSPRVVRIPRSRDGVAARRLLSRRTLDVPTVTIGRARLMCLSLPDAVDAVLDLAAGDRPGLVVTANSDHVVQLRRNDELAAAYERADLRVIDGQPLAWTARLMTGEPVERVTGVDLFLATCAAATPDDRVFLLGGSEANSARAAAVLGERFPDLRIAGRFTGRITRRNAAAVIRDVRESGATIVAVFLGCPRQELWVSRHLHELPPAAYLCLGGTVDIVSGALPRAHPVWQRLGLEWLHRLLREPKRLWRRYLVEDPAVAVVAARSVWRARREGTVSRARVPVVRREPALRG